MLTNNNINNNNRDNDKNNFKGLARKPRRSFWAPTVILYASFNFAC